MQLLDTGADTKADRHRDIQLSFRFFCSRYFIFPDGTCDSVRGGSSGCNNAFVFAIFCFIMLLCCFQHNFWMDFIFLCLITYIASIIFSPTCSVWSGLSGKRKSEGEIPSALAFLMSLNFLIGLKCPGVINLWNDFYRSILNCQNITY